MVLYDEKKLKIPFPNITNCQEKNEELETEFFNNSIEIEPEISCKEENHSIYPISNIFTPIPIEIE